MGLKEHAAVDTENGFILSTNLSTASHHDSKYFPYAICYGMHTTDPIENTHGDKVYTRAPNREFLALNNIGDGIMRKDILKLNEIWPFQNTGISENRTSVSAISKTIATGFDL